MSDLKHHFSELVALTQLFLMREYSPKDKLAVDPQMHQFFKPSLKNTPPVPQPKTTTSTTSTPLTSNPTKQIATPTPPIPNPVPTTSQSPKQFIPQTTIETAPQTHPQPSKIVESVPAHSAIPLKNNEIKSGSRFINLEPLASASPSLEWQDFKQVITEHFPSQKFNEKIPSDSRAQKINSAWQMEQTIPPVIILSFNDQNQHLAFLKNIAKAITLHLAPARVISAQMLEQEKQWNQVLQTPALRLVIASDYGLYMLPGLMQYYKEVPKTAKHFLHRTPLLLLSDLSLYLKEPQLKPLLWRAICTEFEANNA